MKKNLIILTLLSLLSLSFFLAIHPAPVRGTGISITILGTLVMGQPLYIDFTVMAGETGVAYVTVAGKYPVTSPDFNYVVWSGLEVNPVHYTPGTTAHVTVPGSRFTPTQTPPGTYQVLVVIRDRDGGNVIDQATKTFQLVAAPTPSGGGASCLTARLSSSTITQGTSSLTVSGTDSCSPPNTDIDVAIYPNAECAPAPISGTLVWGRTDASFAYSLRLPTSTLTAGSYCVRAQSQPTGGATYGYVMLPLTVTSGSSPPPSGAGAFDFSMALSPSSLTVTAGGYANYPIIITYSNPAYAGTSISVQVAGLGPGMNYQVSTSPPGLSISTSPSTPTGTYTITLTGSAMGVTHQTNAILTVQLTQQQPTQQQPTQQSFDFSLLVSPAQQTVMPGGSTSFTVTVSLVSGDPSRAMVELSVSGTPSGVSASFNPPYGTVTFTSTLNVATTSSATPGTVTLTVTGRWWIAQTGESRTHTAQATLTISQSPQTSIQVTSQAQPTALQPQTVSTQTKTGGLSDLLQQNSVLVIAAIIIILIAAVMMKGRKPSSTPTPQPQPPPQPSGVFCAKCGKPNPTGNQFCLSCGEKLTST